MRTRILIFIFLFYSLNIFAKEVIDSNLAVNKIPDSLRKNAAAVMRYYKSEIDLTALNKFKQNESYAISILNKSADELAVIRELYNQFISIDKISATLYDSTGKEIRKLKPKDIYDRSTFGTGVEVHADTRLKLFTFNHKFYPYTVVIEMDKTFKSTFFMPVWMPQLVPYCAVQQSELKLKTPIDVPIRYKAHKLPDNTKMNSANTDAHITTQWSVANIPAVKKERNGNFEKYTIPAVELKTDSFELYNYKGSMTSWKGFGAFFFELNKDRDILDEQYVTAVKNLVGAENTDIGKIQKLLHYMQTNTRYIGNQYGIAAWQTFEANHVAKNGYGDCKGLTNYLKAMLKVVGIHSIEALVYAGEEQYFRMEDDFVANSFNHVILCIPQNKDTIWVECTSKNLPAGYLGSFTQNRNVLLITQDGGFPARTPHYSMTENRINRKFTINLINNKYSDELPVSIACNFSGLMQDELNHVVNSKTEKEILSLVGVQFKFPSYKVSSFTFTPTEINSENKIPKINEHVETIVSGITSGTQKRTFLNLGWLSNPLEDLTQGTERKNKFFIDKSFATTDSLIVHLPPGASIEATPLPFNMTQSFAKINLEVIKNENTLTIVRHIEQKEGVYEAKLHQDYVNMYNAIGNVNNKLSIVLLNK